MSQPPGHKVALVGNRSVLVSPHAIARYQERVKPAFDVAEALMDLRQVIKHAELLRRAPAWVASGERADGWVVLGDAIAFPIVQGHVATCLTRAVPGDDLRIERGRERRERRERDGRPGARKKHGKVLRDDRRRRRAAKEGVDG